MKIFYLGLFLLSAGIIYAQDGRIGVNTEDPKTTFDVSGKTDTSGNVLVTDMTGLQAPRITLADLSAKGDIYGVNQKGALIYITDVTGGNTTTQRVNISRVGYYYFDGSVWISVGNEPWYNVITNSDASSNTQDIYQMGKVGIATKNPAYQLEVIGDVKGQRLIAFGAGGVDTNSAIGENSLSSNTAGGGNVANGYQALYNNTTGSNNVANGAEALHENTIGDGNVANGYQALYNNSAGNYNIANGTYTLRENITGSYNIANGTYALQSNTTGSYNVANGVFALVGNNGSYNTATGQGALIALDQADYNTALGNEAGVELVTGDSNSFLGYQSGLGITNGSNNVIIGRATFPAYSTLNNNIAIADGAGNTRINVDANGNVGINTTTPTSKLQVVGLPIYADEAAATAAGLTKGTFYSSADGVLRVKL